MPRILKYDLCIDTCIKTLIVDSFKLDTILLQWLEIQLVSFRWLFSWLIGFVVKIKRWYVQRLESFLLQCLECLIGLLAWCRQWCKRNLLLRRHQVTIGHFRYAFVNALLNLDSGFYHGIFLLKSEQLHDIKLHFWIHCCVNTLSCFQFGLLVAEVSSSFGFGSIVHSNWWFHSDFITDFTHFGVSLGIFGLLDDI